MNRFNFFGHSDDLFCVEGDHCDQLDDSQSMTYFLRNTNKNKDVMAVSGKYTASYCWAVTIELLDEDSLPLNATDWDIKFHLAAYGNSVDVICPDHIICSDVKSTEC
ncbi:hypothetical protein ACWX0P_27240 [Vibrio mediterranei]